MKKDLLGKGRFYKANLHAHTTISDGKFTPHELKDKYKHILLLHTDYPGAKDTDGSEVGTAENLNINLASLSVIV